MKGCEVILGGVIKCGELGPDGCAILTNENINNGVVTRIKEALEREETGYLVKLVNNRLGSAFNTCKAKAMLTNTARKILKERKIKIS